MLELVICNPGQKVGLVFDRVDGCGKVFQPVDFYRAGIVACSCKVEFMSVTLLEISELYHAVTHHVGVGGQSLFDRVKGILHDVFPIFIVERYYIEGQSVSAGYEGAHFNVLLCGAVAFAIIIAYLDVKQVQVMALFAQAVYCYSGVYAS